MASQCVVDLRNVGKTLEADGYPVSAAVCHHAADRMERMEQLIVDAKDTFDDIAKTANG